MEATRLERLIAHIPRGQAIELTTIKGPLGPKYLGYYYGLVESQRYPGEANILLSYVCRGPRRPSTVAIPARDIARVSYQLTGSSAVLLKS